MFSRIRQFFAGRGKDKSPGRTGAAGERAAERFLVNRAGFRVVARNWRNPKDRREEIDLVCRNGEVLVFVEVKARAREALVSGFHAVDWRKKKVLRRAIQAYLGALECPPLTFRFDIVEVEMADAKSVREEEACVRHYENILLFPPRYRPWSR